MQKILIVEDDRKIAEYLSKEIEKYGYEVHVVLDFTTVTNEFNSFQPHLVLLDINLPSFDGFYWCRQIRKVSTCPVIFISARTGEMDQVMALEMEEMILLRSHFLLKLSSQKLKVNLDERTVNILL